MPNQPGWPPNGPYPPPQPRRSAWRRLSEDEWPTLRELLGRRRNSLWVMSIPCVWPMTLALMVGYPLARSAHNKARGIFPSHGHRRISDPGVLRVQKTRAWIATAMSALILAVYGKQEDVEQAQQQIWLRVTVTPWLLLLSAPLVVWILYRWSSPAVRQTMREHLRAARRAVLQYFGAVMSLPLLIASMVFSEKVVGASVAPWITLALLVPILWVVLFLTFATGPAVRSAFNTAEVHAALPALLTGVLVWEFAAIGLPLSGPPPGPPLVQFAALLAGPASVTAVAWWEIRRLRVRYGVVLRG